MLNVCLDHSSLIDSYATVTQKFSSVSLSMYGKDQWYVPSVTDPWVVQEIAIKKIHPTYFQAVTSEFEIHKIMCMGEPESIVNLENALRQRFSNLTINKSKPTYLEIMAANVSKSAATQVLAHSMGFERSEFIAIGDSYNDMLRYAGLGVAMGNAPKEVKPMPMKLPQPMMKTALLQSLENISVKMLKSSPPSM